MPNINTLEQMEVRLLSEFSQGFIPGGFFNRLILPPITVLKSRGKYLAGKNGLMLYDTERAPRTQAKQIDHNYGSGEYRTYEHALAHPLDKKEIQAANEVGLTQLQNLKENVISLLISLLELNREKGTADVVFGSTYYHADYQDDIGSTPWNNHSTGDPIGDINAAIKAVREAGAVPNALVMSSDVFDVLKTHPDLVNHFKNQMGVLTAEQIIGLFGPIKKIVVADCMYNSGTEDAEVLTNVWGNHCAVYPIPSPEELMRGARVHAALFDKLSGYHAYEHDQGVLVNYTQIVEWGIEAINNQCGFLIQNTLGS